jgi:O-antigen/teichoic acid export membrane protein
LNQQISDIKARFFIFIRSDFFKNVSILTSGALFGQIILLSISPFLTRIYLPEHFGALSLFTSISVILATFATAKYEFAIALPEKDDDSIHVLLLGCIMSLIFSIFLGLVFWTNSSFFLSLPYFVGGGWWLFLIPANIFLAGINSCLNYWVLRKENYKGASLLNLFQPVFISIANITLGLLGYLTLGLEISFTLSLAFSLLFLAFVVRKSGIIEVLRHNIHKEKLIGLAKRYIDFPKVYLWTHLLSNLTQQLIPLFLASLYTSSIVGFFALSYRIIRLPVNVIASSIANVFKNDAIKETLRVGNSKMLFVSTLKKLTILSGPIFLFLFFILPTAFEIVFGEKWIEAGRYGQIMCAMAFCDFVSTPLTQPIFVLSESHKLNLFYQLLNILISIAGVCIGFYWFNSAYYSILFFSIGNMIYYLLTLRSAYQLA